MVEHLGQESIVDILFTKWDKLLTSEKASQHQAFVEQTEQMIQAEFGTRLGLLTSYRVAARPDESSGLNLCHQMGDMLSRWMAPPAAIATPPLRFSVPNDLRESERYLYRRLPQYVAKKEP